MQVNDIDIDKIKPYPRNAKTHPDEQVEQIAKSIEKFGWAQPLVIDGDGVVVIGHGRLMAAKKLGLTSVPCVEIDGLTDEEIRMLRLADNKIAESPWDFDTLAEELEDLDFGDLDIDFGLDDDPGEVTEDDFDAEPPEEPKSKRGEIYQLGRHRLMCGDSTDAEDAKRLMGGANAPILFTSPPYSDQREYGDNVDVSISFLKKFISTFEPYTETQVVNLGIVIRDREIVQYWDDYIAEAKDSGYKLRAWNVWDKLHPGSIGQQGQYFPLRHEWIFVFGKSNIDINRTVAKKKENVGKGNQFRTVRQEDGTTRRCPTGDMSHSLKKMGSVLPLLSEHNNSANDAKHPARFPVDLPGEYIKAMTDEDDNVIDCFGGSGTTLIACEQLNRTCYMMELEPKYIDIIINRWEQFTGEKAKRIEEWSNGETA